MKYLYVTLLLFVALGLKAQTPVNNFHIVDAGTRQPIPYASVSLLRGNLAINTERDGLLSIPGDLSKMGDIVFISAQNYMTIRTLLSKLSGTDTIALKKLYYSKPRPLADTLNKDSILHKFAWQDIAYYAGAHSQHARFDVLQMAQEFEASVRGTMLTKISIWRLANRESHTDGTRFRLRIYDIDPVNGAPGKDLCNEIIEITNYNDPSLTINLRKYKITIPGKKFFVAIEWLRSFENAGYAPNRSERNLMYKPIVGTLPYKTDKLHIWVLTFGHEWKPYIYFSPFVTDLAMSATVKW